MWGELLRAIILLYKHRVNIQMSITLNSFVPPVAMQRVSLSSFMTLRIHAKYTIVTKIKQI
jgi:hypothetical protein